jgi:hypothetical protein
MFGIGAVADGLHAPYPIEEASEILASVLIITGVMTLGIHHIREWRRSEGLPTQ